jgi:hypothetical protein
LHLLHRSAGFQTGFAVGAFIDALSFPEPAALFSCPKPTAGRRSSKFRKKIDRCAGLSFSFTMLSLCFTPAPLLFFSSSLTWGEDGTESYAVEPAVRREAVAARRPTEEREVLPTAAPKHAVRA